MALKVSFTKGSSKKLDASETVRVNDTLDRVLSSNTNKDLVRAMIADSLRLGQLGEELKASQDQSKKRALEAEFYSLAHKIREQGQTIGNTSGSEVVLDAPTFKIVPPQDRPESVLNARVLVKPKADLPKPTEPGQPVILLTESVRDGRLLGVRVTTRADVHRSGVVIRVNKKPAKDQEARDAQEAKGFAADS